MGQVGTQGKNELLEELGELWELLGEDDEERLLLVLEVGVALELLELLGLLEDERLEDDETLELLTEEPLELGDELLLDDEGGVAELRLLWEEDDERLLLPLETGVVLETLELLCEEPELLEDERLLIDERDESELLKDDLLLPEETELDEAELPEDSEELPDEGVEETDEPLLLLLELDE